MRPILASALVLIPLSAALAGCQSLVPMPGTAIAADIRAAAGQAIVFRNAPEGVEEDAGRTATVLTLADAVCLALGSDSGIQAALSRVRMAQAESWQKRLLPNPVVSVSFRPRAGASPVIDASIAEELVSLLTRPGRISAADGRLRAASAEAVSAVLDTIADVRQRYAAVQALDALIPVLEQRQRLLGQLVELAQARLRAGEGTRLDVTTLQAKAVDLAVDIMDKTRERQSERLALARLIGRPGADPAWALDAWQTPDPAPPQESTWVAAALARRPEIEARRWELAALGAEARLARFDILEGADAGIDSERDVEWSVGPSLSVPVPLFDWGQARRVKADAAVTEAGHLLTQARRQVVLEVRQARSDYVQSLAALRRVEEELLPLEESRRQQTEAAYRSGQADIAALILAEQDLQEARTKGVDLRHKVSDSLIRLERAAGGPGAVPPRAPSTQPAATAPFKGTEP